MKILSSIASTVSGLLPFAGAALLLRQRLSGNPAQFTDLSDLETYLEMLVKKGTPPGLTLAVMRGNETVYTRGFGYADGPNRVPAEVGTVYRWWSVTKIVTAIAIMQLSEQGLLDIDAPVSEILPYFEMRYRNEGDLPVTVRHLLNHSSGMPDNVPEVMGWMHLVGEERPDQTTLLQHVLPNYTKLKFSPGHHSVYTNVGYMVLGAIVERVSGLTYEEYVKERILQPLDMSQTSFLFTPEMIAHAAAGSHPLVNIQTVLLPVIYGRRLSGFVRQTWRGRLWFNRFYPNSDPPTGLIGPAGEMARLGAIFLNGGEWQGNRILSHESVRVMMEDSWVPVKGFGQTDAPLQGLGWEVRSHDHDYILMHGGGGPGFGCAIHLYPDRKLVLVVMANDTTYDSPGILDLAAKLDW